MQVRVTATDGTQVQSSDLDAATALVTAQQLVAQGFIVQMQQVRQERRVVGFAQALTRRQDEARNLIEAAFEGVTV
jgi:hypothetical protein